MSEGEDQRRTRDTPSGDVEGRFQTMVEHIPMIVTYMDLVEEDALHPRPVYISPQIEDLLGYPREDWLTDDALWVRVLHPDDLERMLDEDARARRALGSSTVEYRMVARDGRVVWVSETAAFVTDEATGDVYWQGVMVDITARKAAQAALEASERRFTSLFEAAAIGVVTLDLDGRIDEANRMLEQVGGYAAGSAQRTPVSPTCSTPPTRRSCALYDELAAATCDDVELEHRLRRDDASFIWCRTVMTLVRDASGRCPIHVIGMLEDISERKRDEEALVHRVLHDGLTGLPNRQLFLERLRTGDRASETGPRTPPEPR